MESSGRLSARIKQEGRRLGFHEVAITTADRLSDFKLYEAWISNQFHGEMSYLERHLEKKEDPKRVFPEARSIVCCALSYKTTYQNAVEPKPQRGVISNYAWGEDYHAIMEKKLREFFLEIQRWLPATQGKYYCDTGPLMERSLARRAGIGWIGKNTCVINQTHGSYLFLGEILLNLDLEPDAPETDHCGSCTQCLDACPTQALIEPYQMDATRCIAYLTIEKRGDFTPSQERMIGSHLFGCDICQTVCPWNDKAVTPDLAFFRPRPGFYEPRVEQLSSLSEDDFQTQFQKSPIKRTKYKGWTRNLKAVQNNQMLAFEKDNTLQ